MGIADRRVLRRTRNPDNVGELARAARSQRCVPMTLSFVTTSAQPDLVPRVVDWLREEFGHAGSPSREQQIAAMLAQPDQSEETFVLLDDSVPVGTASLVNSDLPSHPDLTPWLASVLVLPPLRYRRILVMAGGFRRRRFGISRTPRWRGLQSRR